MQRFYGWDRNINIKLEPDFHFKCRFDIGKYNFIQWLQ